jgi:hypothetical protein
MAGVRACGRAGVRARGRAGRRAVRCVCARARACVRVGQGVGRRRGRRALPRAECASEKQSRKARQLTKLSRHLTALVALSSDVPSPCMAARPAHPGGVGVRGWGEGVG